MRCLHGGARSVAVFSPTLGLILGLTVALWYGTPALAAQCGGATLCQCGDTVIADYTMSVDLGPCPRLPPEEDDTVGLSVDEGVTLDCQGHTITGPGDTERAAFGIRMGRRDAPEPTSNVTIRNCKVTKFWWGIFVQNARDIVLDSNEVYENGWKDLTVNGTGYGFDIANSTAVTIRNNHSVDNGDEGIHLTHSTNVTIEGNVFLDNGKEQVYLIFADDNIIRHNFVSGGKQGLEMRSSNNNHFSYNVWGAAPKHWLENDNTQNVFHYEHFEGMVLVQNRSTGNRFELSEFKNPGGDCLKLASTGIYVYKGRFTTCGFDIRTDAQMTCDRCVDVNKKKGAVKLLFRGCTADIDLDADVDDVDRVFVLTAIDSHIGDPTWNPEGDLDHDGDVDSHDLTLFDDQIGRCIQG